MRKPVDKSKAMNAIIERHVRRARADLRRHAKVKLEDYWRAAMDELIKLSLPNRSFSQITTTEDLIQRSRQRSWSFERFRDRVVTP